MILIQLIQHATVTTGAGYSLFQKHLGSQQPIFLPIDAILSRTIIALLIYSPLVIPEESLLCLVISQRPLCFHTRIAFLCKTRSHKSSATLANVSRFMRFI